VGTGELCKPTRQDLREDHKRRRRCGLNTVVGGTSDLVVAGKGGGGLSWGFQKVLERSISSKTRGGMENGPSEKEKKTQTSTKKSCPIRHHSRLPQNSLVTKRGGVRRGGTRDPVFVEETPQYMIHKGEMTSRTQNRWQSPNQAGNSRAKEGDPRKRGERQG